MFEWLLNFFKGFWGYIKIFFLWLIDSVFAPFRWALDGFFTVITAIFYLIFDGFLTAVTLIFKGFDFSSMVFSSVGSSLGLPDAAVWFITQLGLPQCVTMITVAIGIRMLLNLIPAAVTRI